MQHPAIPLDELARRVVREVVCTSCTQRAELALPWNPTLPRRCERYCPIMLSIGTLLDAAGDTDTSEPGSCEHVIRERVCTSCRQALGSGDYCAEFLARTCPLSRNAERLLTALEKLIAARATVKA